MITALVLAATLVTQAVQDARVQRAVVVQPETVTVGDPFRVVVRVRGPRGSEIGFPEGPDSTEFVEAVDPVQILTAPDTTANDMTATYRLSAWDVGEVSIPLGAVRVVYQRDVREISLGSISVFVRSVLPADTALHIPKPARDIIALPTPWWWWLLVAAAVLAIVALIWWWLRRRRRLQLITPADPYEEAIAAFARVEALGLVAAGERGRYVALVVEVLREYMMRIDVRADLSLTTSELLAAISGIESFPGNQVAGLLVEADLIKFARRPITAAHATSFGTEARAIVDAIHGARQVPVPAAQAAA